MAESIGDLVVKVGANIDGFSEAVESIPQKFLAVLDEVNPVIAGVVTAIVGIGGAALAVGIEYDEAFDTIIAKTGATGDQLDGLKQSFENVFTAVPGDAQTVASALSLVSDRLHLTGEDLDALAIQLGQLATVERADLVPLTEGVTKAFQNWNVATVDQKDKLDLLNVIAQKTGSDVTSLATSMAEIGNTARLSGASFEQTAFQIGTLSSKGVEAGDMFGAISRAMAQAQKAGADLGDVTLPNLVFSIEQGIKSGNGLNVAMTEFGAKAGPKMYELVKDGIISSVQLMKTSLDASTDSIKKTYEATDDLGRQFTMLGKNLKSFLEPLGSWLAGGAKDFLAVINSAITGNQDLAAKINTTATAQSANASSFSAGKISLEAYSKGLEDAGAKSTAAALSSLDLGISLKGVSEGLVDVAAKEAAAKERTEILKDAVKELAAADSQHAENIKAAAVPALTDLATAEQNVTIYRQEAIGADNNLLQAELNLRDIIKSHAATNQQLKDAEDAVTLAKEASKTANQNLTEAEKSLTASKTDDASITTLLRSATQAVADAIRTDHVPALLSIIAAEEAVVAARNETGDAIQREQAAIKALSDFQNSTGFRDAETEEKLKSDVRIATDSLTAARNKEASAIKDADLIKTSAKALDSDILANAKLLNSFLKDNLIGTNKSLTESMKDLNEAKQRQLDSWNALQSALQEEQRLQLSGVVDIQAQTAARNQARQASDDYKRATDYVNASEAEAQRNFRLSRDEILALAASVSGAVTSAQTLQSAYNVLGIQTAESMRLAAQAADAAFADILATGTTNAHLLREAQIADINAQIAAWETAGKAVPANQQIMLAQLEQQEKDYKANSVTRWTDLYNTIHSTFTGMWNGLTKDFFEGGDFLDTITTAMKHVGESIVDKIMQPFTDQIDAVLSSILTKLTSKLGDWISGALGTIIPGIGPASGAGGAAGGATSGAGSAGGDAAGTLGSLSSGITGLVTAISSVVSAIGSLGSFITGMETNSKLARIEENTRSIAFYTGGNDSGGGILLNTFLIKDAILYGYATQDLNQIKDLTFGMRDALAAISQNTLWTLKKADEIDFNTYASLLKLSGIDQSLLALVAEVPMINLGLVNIATDIQNIKIPAPAAVVSSPGGGSSQPPASMASNVTINVGTVYGEADFLDKINQGLGAALRLQGVTA